MERNPSSAEELKTIRQIMEESKKFLSLSGLSGIFPGIFATAGALIAYFLILDSGKSTEIFFSGKSPAFVRNQMFADAFLVLLLSLGAAFYFSVRRARSSGRNILTPVAKRLLITLFIPLITGGIFALTLMHYNQISLVIPVFLVFYGLALTNAGKLTYNEVFYLGILEIITGLIAAFFPFRGLLFWILGFGILHIIYGVYMYRRYEA